VRIMVDENDDQLQNLFQRLGFRRGKLIDYTKTFKVE
jgi:ribosomal protein S18 acetylase RimI-like enzyme